MGKDSALYQLMDVRMNGVINGIVSSDGEYPAIIRKSDEYSGVADCSMNLRRFYNQTASSPSWMISFLPPCYLSDGFLLFL